MLWPFLRRSAWAVTIKAVRGTVATKGTLTIKGRSFPLTGGGGVRSPYHRLTLQGDQFPLRASFTCLVVDRGPEL